MNLIIGAGISGLTIANNLQTDFQVLEKQDHVGGISTQYPSEEYWFDYGGHYFHFLNKSEIKEYVETFSKFREFQRKSQVFIMDRFIPFPIQFHLSYLPSKIKQRIVKEILGKLHKSKSSSIENTDLGSYLRTHFGDTLYQLFFQPFLTKYYNRDLSHLISNMDRGSIPVPDKGSIQKGAEGKRFFKTGYNPVFYYPANSLRSFIKAYSEKVQNTIRFNQEVVEIDLEKRIVKTRDTTYNYQTLVNTMPLNYLLKTIKQNHHFPPSEEFKHITTQVTNVVLKKKRKRTHWFYLPQKFIPFYRVGFYPVQKAPVCYLEKTISHGQSIDQKKITEEVAYTLKKLQLIEHSSEIIHLDTKVIPVSYILFNKKWWQNVPPTLTKLKEYGLHSIGRYGSWNYTSMSDDIQSALQCAQTINNLL